MKMSIKKEDFQDSYTKSENTTLGDYEVLRVVKAEKMYQFDENTLVKLKYCSFHNGIIKVKMLSRLLPDAPDFARGFIGIVFRVKEDNSEFESFYIRPTNAMTDDPVRKSHGCQYFSYPGYTFAYFREFAIKDYEAEMPVVLDQWTELKAIIHDDQAEFYLDDQFILKVNDLKHGNNLRGSVGFFSEIGTEAFFKDLEIEFED